ncbi:DUF4153 domain-containing protein [Arenimonas maotaiensis]|uniref:DUF4153 domain-containing protein n=1 Tax=Arenimonas maotaiensis TaxID=1446479 RepID=A0A917FHL8_9GAMM|nr:DUF4153 domain-containing protein [Arenimonas maotaiensis]GGF83726.1 DUF4153 domain-containing protein [Arenimonas maotaiensis]
MSETESRVPRSDVNRATAGARVLIGLLQGLALYLIYQAAENGIWNAGNSGLFAALLLVAAIAPGLAISGLGHIPGRSLLRWLLPAALVLALLGFYDIWRSLGAPDWRYGVTPGGARYPSPELWVHALAGFFIAHSMVTAAALDGRRIASYRSYFESSWKLLIQVAFAAAFTGLSWLVLVLGAALFHLITLDFLRDMLDEPWFAIPVTTFAFAYALHITDVRPAIVHGVRSLVLVLLSWILPVAVLLIGGFLLALPFTGLEPLWATKAATALLLAASAVLAVLINAAFQDGSVSSEVALPIRFGAKIAVLLILPLALIAAYALSLRVGQYGWTVDRLVAAFCLVVALGCGAGYFWAALRSPQWLSRIAPVNIFTAFMLLFLLLAIFSPALDPARISVNSQVAHLRAGNITAAAFDYDYLRFSGQRFGQDALRDLQSDNTLADAATVRLKAAAALAKQTEWNAQPAKMSRELLATNIRVWPNGAALPADFLAQDWPAAMKDESWQYPECLRDSGKTCDAYLIDLDADGTQEVALQLGSGSLGVLKRGPQGWHRIGNLLLPFNCPGTREALRAGRFAVVPPVLRELEIAGTRYRMDLDDKVEECGETEKAGAPPPS